MKGFVIAGTGSGVGKTSIATGLMSALSKKYRVQAFKAGPDFIDPMYHRAATGRPSRNLDSFMMDDGRIRNLVGFASRDADLCIVEGVRGLYEGFSGDGDLGSTAYLAKILGLPVVLVVNAGSLTRSAAAVINGFRAFDPDVRIAGVILNKVSGGQHADKLDTVMSTYCRDVKLLGKIRKDPENTLEQRYLGLTTLNGYETGNIEPLERLVETVDLDMLVGIAESFPTELPTASPYVERSSGLKAAVPYDDAYCFLYRENIECLQASGVDVRFFRPTEGEPLPDADMAYLCGGYPELYAERISANRDFLEGLKQMSDEGRPILGECGGMMTLCSEMKVKSGGIYPMAGCFDAAADMVGKRHGPTYVIAEATESNPLFRGTLRGHEYHYSEVVPRGAEFCFEVKRGQGISGGMDGMLVKRTVGTYLHQHALSHEDWARGFVDSYL
ncbi:MAG: hydrogenobyrinic acid a,c-diamide synthase (glutamine-hydrolyzing) [Candidatus Methanomethylophilus sp.]|nr:hydrogenobyrinic acid a,c-diamide synthase (glutamine-hydrolyzing) [Methanomethylophilus sp.]